jgi:hypothetical protein
MALNITLCKIKDKHLLHARSAAPVAGCWSQLSVQPPTLVLASSVIMIGGLQCDGVLPALSTIEMLIGARTCEPHQLGIYSLQPLQPMQPCGVLASTLLPLQCEGALPALATIEMPLVRVLAAMEMRGICLNPQVRLFCCQC